MALLKCAGCRQYLYFIERLGTVEAIPVMDTPVFIVQFNAIVVFLEEVRSTAIRAHDRFRHHSSDFHAQDAATPARRRENLYRLLNAAGAADPGAYFSLLCSKP